MEEKLKGKGEQIKGKVREGLGDVKRDLERKPEKPDLEKEKSELP